jgi:hypothetical protein
MRKAILILAALIGLFASPSLAQVTYPQCPGPFGGVASCTMTILITATATPIFKANSQRQYLFLQNTGCTNANVVSNNAIWCAINSGNNPIATGSNMNTFIIQPGGVYQPPQIVKPQNAFTVPSGDISCIAPSGNAYLTIEQE